MGDLRRLQKQFLGSYKKFHKQLKRFQRTAKKQNLESEAINSQMYSMIAEFEETKQATQNELLENFDESELDRRIVELIYSDDKTFLNHRVIELDMVDGIKQFDYEKLNAKLNEGSKVKREAAQQNFEKLKKLLIEKEVVEPGYFKNDENPE